jgi:hypothetical protein
MGKNIIEAGDISNLVKLHRAGFSYSDIAFIKCTDRSTIQKLLKNISPKTDRGADAVNDKYALLKAYIGDDIDIPEMRYEGTKRYSQRLCHGCGAVLEDTRALYCNHCNIARGRLRNQKAYQRRVARRTKAALLNKEVKRLVKEQGVLRQWRCVARDNDIQQFLAGTINNDGINKLAEFFGVTPEYWSQLVKGE